MVLPPPRPTVPQHLLPHLPTELPHLVVAAVASAAAVLAAVVLEAAVSEAAVSAPAHPRQAMEPPPVRTEHPRRLQAVMVLLAAAAAAAMVQAVGTLLAADLVDTLRAAMVQAVDTPRADLVDTPLAAMVQAADTPRAAPVVTHQEDLVSAVVTLAAAVAAMAVAQEVTHQAEVADTPPEAVVDTRRVEALVDTPLEVDIPPGARRASAAVTHQAAAESPRPSARATTPTAATCTRAGSCCCSPSARVL